jgi:vacuolar-type H+-ATPase subunit E/Vma4
MKELTEAVLDRIREQAQAIEHAAEEEAARELDKAKSRREQRIEAERKRLLLAAEAEATRIIAKGVMQARNTVAAAKSDVMHNVLARARAELEALPAERDALAGLIAEAVSGLGGEGKVVVGVRADDLELVREIVSGDERLSVSVGEVVERPIGGGVIVESEDGSTVVDNSHAARLEMLVPRILARFGRELF